MTYVWWDVKPYSTKNSERSFYVCLHRALVAKFLHVVHLYNKISKLHSLSVTCLQPSLLGCYLPQLWIQRPQRLTQS